MASLISITISPSALLLCIFLKRHLNWYCLISLMCITYIKALKVIWHHQFVLGMRGLWNIKALSSNKIVDCRFIHTQGETAEIVIHTQGESWDCSYSWSESWDYKSQPFKDRVFQPDDVLSLFRNKGKLAQWTENDKRITTTWSDLKMTLKNLFVPKLILWMNDCGGWIPQWLKRTTPLISILYQVTHATNIPMCPTNFTFFF